MKSDLSYMIGKGLVSNSKGMFSILLFLMVGLLPATYASGAQSLALGLYRPAQIKDLQVEFWSMAVTPQGWPRLTLRLNARTRTASAEVERVDPSENVLCTGSQEVSYNSIIKELVSDKVETITIPPSNVIEACGDCTGPALNVTLADGSVHTYNFESEYIDLIGGQAIAGHGLEDYLSNLANSVYCSAVP